MHDCDIVIVGGGPAGSTLAWLLVAQGWQVVVLDKQEFPRDKVCAGWITPAVVSSLQLDLNDYAQGRTLQDIHQFRTSFIGGHDLLTSYADTASYGIRRREFDDYLLRRSGAELHLGEPLQSAGYHDGHWHINNRWRSPLLIGAGGHYCPVARRLGAQLGQAEAPITAQEIELEMTAEQAAACPIAGDTPELFFTPQLDGYGWLFRKGDVLNIGLGRKAGGRLADSLAEFVDSLQRQGKLQHIELPQRWHGHAYLCFTQRQSRQLIDDGVLLLGDAAGLAYPQSGEGILPAIESALLAAEVIIAAKNDYRHAQLQPYVDKLISRFGSRLATSDSTSRWLPAALQQKLARYLLNNPWFTRHIVLDRWFLHRHLHSLGKH